MMAVLVTGGMGYIGSHTCLELLNSGYEVVSIDNLCNSNPVSLRRVEELAGKPLKSYIGDVRDADLLRQIFSENDIECVIHFAGLKAVGESVEKPWEYYDNNLNTTLVLTKVMKEVGMKNIIFSSSATVYTSDNEMPLQETSRTGGCTNPYGWTKYMTEQILSGLSHADPDWSVTLLRYFNPIGAHPSGRIGEDPRGIPNNLMPYITQVAIGRRDHLSVFGNDYPTPDGTCIRDYIHVVDLAQGHVAAVQYAVRHKGTEIFNLGTGRGSSVLEMVNTFMVATGAQVPYEITGRRAGDIAVCYADPTKSREILGWTAQKTLADMCRDSWNWQSHNPNGFDSSHKKPRSGAQQPGAPLPVFEKSTAPGQISSRSGNRFIRPTFLGQTWEISLFCFTFSFFSGTMQENTGEVATCWKNCRRWPAGTKSCAPRRSSRIFTQIRPGPPSC